MYEKTIKKFRTPIGEGLARVAFYSKKHKLVFKRDRFNYLFETDQTAYEIKMIKKLTKEEKEVFPVVDIIVTQEENGKIVRWILMKKALLLSGKQFFTIMHAVHGLNCGLSIESLAKQLEAETGFPTNKNLKFLKFIEKHNVRDLHEHNIRRIKDQIVVIDAGL